MEQRTAVTAPPGWQIAARVDSRLEADLVARLLAAHDIAAVVVARGNTDFSLYVAAGDLEAAGQLLDVD